MFKKTVLVGAIALAASGVALADGFYVGAGLGATSFNDTMTMPGRADNGMLGVIGGIYGGYTFNFANQFNLGLEAFGNATSAQIKNNNNPDVTVKSRYSYGVRALPGYQLTPDTEVHLLAGYVRGNFKQSVSTSNVSAITANKTNTFNANGFQLGAGTGTNIAKNVALRGDLIFSGFQSKTLNGIKNRVNTLDGVASIAYKFG